MFKLRAVSKTFNTGEVETTALDRIDLDIEAGEYLAITGPSGCGKSTLLGLLGLLDTASSGEYWFDGDNISGWRESQLNRLRRGRIGFVFQSFNLIDDLSAAENIALALEYGDVPAREHKKRIDEAMARLGISHRAGHRPHQLSGGQQQRVGVARALASDPDILLMDEPFGAVDPIVRAELQVELNRLQRELGKTTVFVTHDIDEAFTIADQVVIFRTGGVIAQVGTPAEILANPADDFVATFIGADKGKRTLHLQHREGDSATLIVDGDGRPAGILGSDR